MDKQDILISVIVPIYKVEQYLDECIESIINQTYKKLEIILVDDGSPDGCSEICDKYAAIDNRIKVIHKENRGLVSARKAGVAIANGDYITFVDGDDSIAKNLYEEIVASLTLVLSDIIAFSFQIQNANQLTVVENRIKTGVYDKENIEKNIIPNLFFYEEMPYCGVESACWCKLFKKQLIKDNIIDISNEVTIGEDIAISYLCIIKSGSLQVINNIKGYYYRYNEEAMTKKYNPDYLYTQKILFESIEYIFKDYLSSSNEIKKKITRFEAGQIINQGMANETTNAKGNYIARLYKYFKNVQNDSLLIDIVAEARNDDIFSKKKKLLISTLVKKHIILSVLISLIPNILFSITLGRGKK